MTTFTPTAYQFVHNIAHHFDKSCYPKSLPCDIVHPADQNLVKQVHQMPSDVQQSIYNQAPSISKWFLTTGFIAPPEKDANQETLKWEAIESSARHRLESVGKGVGFWTAPSTQLLHHIFEKALTDATPDEVEHIIQQLEPFRPRLDHVSFKFQRFLFKVESLAITILSNWYVQCILSYVAYVLFSHRIQPWAVAHLNRHILPRSVNLIINHAPLPVIRVIDSIIRAVQFVLTNPLKVTVVFYGVRWVSSRIDPRTGVIFRIVGIILFLPSKAKEFLGSISSYVFNHTWTMQGVMAHKLTQIKDKSQVRHSQEEILKAYQLWMDLMQKGEKRHLFVSSLS